MRSPRCTFSIALALAAALLAGTALMPAMAGLGGSVSSIQNDQLSMKGQLRTRSEPGYSVQEITAATGTVVREFVSPAGVVFAVSWKGPTMPNLQQAFGTYFAQFEASVKAQRSGPAKRPGHNHLEVRTPSLVVHAGGHMREYFGMAYVPALMPPNLSTSDLH
jgi:hypothetical protein